MAINKYSCNFDVISVMGKLPATSYVRLVDIWLIFVQLYPFIEVVLFTIIEMHIEEEITNNHGRLKRFVPETKNHNLVCYVLAAKQ